MYLWWPLKRATVKWGGASRRGWFDLHNTVGIFSLAFLLVLAFLIGFEKTTVPLFHRMTASQPAPRCLAPLRSRSTCRDPRARVKSA